ncbi:NUDIX hydrolase [Primorskyibacter aestuariivivens]|nr:NUDIX hydrolase [Primorskyibacter aestuariivivens]MDA7430499.1 NUDIX hydrolase [Primorskyibacter aestuariivivens]
MSDDHIVGAKLALFLGGALLVIRRDDDPDIPWPGHLDLPGGGREAGETAEVCVLRETREEVGLRLGVDALVYRRDYTRPHGTVAFFAAHLPIDAAGQVVFGDEGQGWMLMAAGDFVACDDAVPHFREQVAAYLSHLSGAGR